MIASVSSWSNTTNPRSNPKPNEVTGAGSVILIVTRAFANESNCQFEIRHLRGSGHAWLRRIFHISLVPDSARFGVFGGPHDVAREDLDYANGSQ
jgi:hypothetical protein